MPNVTITIGGKSFELSAETLNFGTYGLSGDTCIGGIAGSENLGGQLESSICLSLTYPQIYGFLATSF